MNRGLEMLPLNISEIIPILNKLKEDGKIQLRKKAIFETKINMQEDIEDIEDDEEYEIAADAFDEWMDSQEFDESDIEE